MGENLLKEIQILFFLHSLIFCSLYKFWQFNLVGWGRIFAWKRVPSPKVSALKAFYKTRFTLISAKHLMPFSLALPTQQNMISRIVLILRWICTPKSAVISSGQTWRIFPTIINSLLHTRFQSTKLPFTRICKLLIRPTSYVKFVLIRVASNWCSVQLRPYSSLFVPNRLPGHRNECDVVSWVREGNWVTERDAIYKKNKITCIQNFTSTSFLTTFN